MNDAWRQETETVRRPDRLCDSEVVPNFGPVHKRKTSFSLPNLRHYGAFVIIIDEYLIVFFFKSRSLFVSHSELASNSGRHTDGLLASSPLPNKRDERIQIVTRRLNQGCIECKHFAAKTKRCL